MAYDKLVASSWRDIRNGYTRDAIVKMESHFTLEGNEEPRKKSIDTLCKYALATALGRISRQDAIDQCDERFSSEYSEKMLRDLSLFTRDDDENNFDLSALVYFEQIFGENFWNTE